MNEYAEYDAVALADLVRSGEARPEDLLDAALGTIAKHNPVINAVVTSMHDEAAAAIAAGLPAGPFTGVPFLLKDLRALYEGVPTTAGSSFLAGNVPDHDSELVRRYKAAGMVITGKTNTPEFGGAPTTEPRHFGPTRNPWNPDHSSGGSSGGSAAAVAARMVPAAHGSDGGGSIRIPAGCCGVFGFKPTRGRTPAGPDYGEAWNGLSAEHAITRSVRDSAAILDATAGPALGDPYSTPPPERPFLEEAERDPGPLRIAVQYAPASGAPIHDDCVAAVRATADMLSDLGHRVEESAPTYDAAAVGPAYRLLIAANVQAAIDEYAERLGRSPGPGELERIIEILAAEGRKSTAADMARAVWTMHRAGRAVAPFFETYECQLTPTVATPPPPLGLIDTMSDDVDAFLTTVFGFIPFTALANIAGIPGMSVPLHWNGAGLPIGVHFVSGYGRDGLLFQLAGQLERAHPWADRRPPLAG